MMTFDRITFILLLIYRLGEIIFVQTSFVPDEYWQSLEVAHNLQFGYGYLTWEWKKAIRSCVYPRIISLIYSIFPDTQFTLIYLPRIFQAVLSAVGDFFTVKLSIKLFGGSTGKWTLFCILTSYFLFYCSSRTLINMTETSLSAWGLYLYPWKPKKFHRFEWTYLWVAGFNFVVRPTAAILWFPLCIWHIFQKRNNLVHILIRITLVGMVMMIIQIIVDYSCYKRLVLTPLQFFISNWSNDIGEFYGSHPWHWYITVGMPVVMLTHCIPLLLGLCLKSSHLIFYIIFMFIAVLSHLGHKEFRFLLPITPLCLCVCGFCLSEISSGRMQLLNWKLDRKLSIVIGALMVFVNIPCGIYLGYLHQRGTLDAMNYLSDAVTDNSNVLYLMPCHSTPYYSHIHKNISMKFLTCEPNFENQANYLDEADLFYLDPKSWLETYLEEVSSDKLKNVPSHIVMFHSLEGTIFNVLRHYNYKLCFSAMHAHFYDKRISQYVHIYCKE